MKFNNNIIDFGPVADDAAIALNDCDIKTTEFDVIIKNFEDAINKVVSTGTFDRSDECNDNQFIDCYTSSEVSSSDSKSLTEFPASKEGLERVTSDSRLEDMNNSDISYFPTSERIHGGQRAAINTKNVVDTHASNSDEPLIKIETSDIKLSDLTEDSTVARVDIPEINQSEVDNGKITATFFNAVNNSDITISKSEKPAPRSHSEHTVHSNLVTMSTNDVTPNNDSTSLTINNDASTVKGSTQKKKLNTDNDKKKKSDNVSNSKTKSVTPSTGNVQLEVNEVIVPPTVVAKGKGFVIKNKPTINNKRKAVQPKEASGNALTTQIKKRRTVRFADTNEDDATATAAAASLAAPPKAQNTPTVVSAPPVDAVLCDTLTSGSISPVAPVAPVAPAVVAKQDSKELKLPTIVFNGYAVKNDLISHQLLISDAYGVEVFVDSFENQLKALNLNVDLHWFTLLEICFEGQKSKNLHLYEWFKKSVNEGLSWSAAKSIILGTFGYFSKNLKDSIKHELNFGYQSSDQDFKSYFLWFCQIANAAVSIVTSNPSALNATDSGLAYVFINKLYFATKMIIPLLDLWGEDNRFNPSPTIPWKQFEDLVKQKMEFLMAREKVFRKEKIVEEKKEMEKKRVETAHFFAKRAEEEAEKLRLEELEKKRLEELEKNRMEELEKKRMEELEREHMKKQMEKFEIFNRKYQEELERQRLEELEQKRLEEIEKQRWKQILMERRREIKLQQKIERIEQKKQMRKEARKAARKERRRIQLLEEAKRQKEMLIANRKAQGLCTFCGVAKHTFKHSRVCKMKKNIVQSWNQNSNIDCCS